MSTMIGRLLKVIGTVTLPATTTWFIAKNVFLLGPSTKTGYDASEDFARRFSEKIEGSMAKQSLIYHELHNPSADDPIIAELGGEEWAETSLTVIHGLIVSQRNGEQGALLTNGLPNVFYVRDASGILCSIIVSRLSPAWSLDAYPRDHPDECERGSRVFSPDPDS